MDVSMDWSKISILSVVAFIIGVIIFDWLWAIVIAIIVLILTGALTIRS